MGGDTVARIQRADVSSRVRGSSIENWHPATSRLGIAQPSVGAGFELDAIAAVVIGGGVMSGGSDGAIGTFCGVLALGFIDNLLNQFNVQSYYQQIVKGLIILAAVISRRKK